VPQQSDILSFGILCVIVALTLVAFSLGIITRLDQMVALIIAFFGVWTIALSGIRARTPSKYGRSASSTLAMGVIFVAVGGAWFLLTVGTNLILTLALLLVVVGILAVVSALPSFRRKPQ
jgi:hypothetical protein